MSTYKPDDQIQQIALKLSNKAFDCFDFQKRLEHLRAQITQNGDLIKLYPTTMKRIEVLITKIDRVNELADEAISDLENYLKETLE